MAKKSNRVKPAGINLKFDINELSKQMERSREERKQAKKRQRRNDHKKFIKSGIEAGFTLKQVLWIVRHFSKDNHEHWDGRIGPSHDD